MWATAIIAFGNKIFDALVLDFENVHGGRGSDEEGRRLNSGNAPVTVALVADRANVRGILSAGRTSCCISRFPKRTRKPGCGR